MGLRQVEITEAEDGSITLDAGAEKCASQAEYLSQDQAKALRDVAEARGMDKRFVRDLRHMKKAKALEALSLSPDFFVSSSKEEAAAPPKNENQQQWVHARNEEELAWQDQQRQKACFRVSDDVRRKTLAKFGIQADKREAE